MYNSASRTKVLANGSSRSANKIARVEIGPYIHSYLSSRCLRHAVSSPQAARAARAARSSGKKAELRSPHWASASESRGIAGAGNSAVGSKIRGGNIQAGGSRRNKLAVLGLACAESASWPERSCPHTAPVAVERKKAVARAERVTLGSNYQNATGYPAGNQGLEKRCSTTSSKPAPAHQHPMILFSKRRPTQRHQSVIGLSLHASIPYSPSAIIEQSAAVRVRPPNA